MLVPVMVPVILQLGPTLLQPVPTVLSAPVTNQWPVVYSLRSRVWNVLFQEWQPNYQLTPSLFDAEQWYCTPSMRKFSKMDFSLNPYPLLWNLVSLQPRKAKPVNKFAWMWKTNSNRYAPCPPAHISGPGDQLWVKLRFSLFSISARGVSEVAMKQHSTMALFWVNHLSKAACHKPPALTLIVIFQLI